MIRLALRVQREQAEIVLAELLELAPGGVEELSDGDVVEYAVYGAPGELPDLPDLRAAAGAALVEVSTTEVADDWDERWKAFHQPVQVGELYVRPPWAPPRDGLRDVVIDPAQAFGTGAHPTTRLCLELLLELEPGGALVDVGCGSGVLAIAAARLGWAPVLGIDHERESVQATLDNAAANGVARAGAPPRPAARRARARRARSSWPTSCARCCCASPPTASPAARPTCSSPAGCSRTRATRWPAPSRATACARPARRHGGEWVALLLRR